jgi:ABC transporter substrate binding protein
VGTFGLGGLASYGADGTDLFWRAAQYVDCTLKGEKPGDLPIQAPTKFKLVLNLKDTKAIGITVPDFLQLLAEVVIEQGGGSSLRGSVVWWLGRWRRGAQLSTMPVIGYLSNASADLSPQILTAFSDGLNSLGFVDGRDVAVICRWADSQNERLPALAADLVRRQVTAIAAVGGAVGPCR